MNQLENNVNIRSFPVSKALYDSSEVSKEQGLVHRRLDALKNNQGFPHFCEQVKVKKLVQVSKTHFGS